MGSSPGVLVLLCAPVVGLAANVLLQALISRIPAYQDATLRVQFVSFAGGASVTAYVMLAFLWGAPFADADEFGYFALHMLVYGCFGFVFFNMISAHVTSLRVRMMHEYLAHDPTPLLDTDLYARYPASQMVLARLRRLERGGQVDERGGRYYLRAGGVAIIGKFFAGLRRFLIGT